jgi:hypothetical protein
MGYGSVIRKVDDNHKQISKEFEALGCTVQSLHIVGKGCPDILVGYKGKNYLFEVKDGTKPNSQKKLTTDEVEFFQSWKGQVAMIESIEEVKDFYNSVK